MGSSEWSGNPSDVASKDPFALVLFPDRCSRIEPFPNPTDFEPFEELLQGNRSQREARPPRNVVPAPLGTTSSFPHQKSWKHSRLWTGASGAEQEKPKPVSFPGVFLTWTLHPTFLRGTLVQVKIKEFINHHSSELTYPCKLTHIFQRFVLPHFYFGFCQEVPHPPRSILCLERGC